MSVMSLGEEELYREVLRPRKLELALIDAVNTGKAVHVGHPVSGQEAVAAGVCAALQHADKLYCSHRVKHWALAKGCELARVAAEYWGKSSGLAEGRGGEMRMMDETVGFMGSNPVVGSALPQAVGSALAAKMDAAGRIAVVAFGDGASVQGTFHESLNLAAVWNVPVLFVCENNLYAESTPLEYYSRPTEIVAKARTYGIEAIRVDGQDAVRVRDASLEIVNQMRRDGRPRLLEAMTYRFLGHFFGDKTLRYRSEREEAHWRARDPVLILKQRVAPSAHVAFERIEREVTEEVDAAMKAAEAAPEPSWRDDARPGVREA